MEVRVRYLYSRLKTADLQRFARKLVRIMPSTKDLIQNDVHALLEIRKVDNHNHTVHIINHEPLTLNGQHKYFLIDM
jgi:hypothetical protein